MLNERGLGTKKRDQWARITIRALRTKRTAIVEEYRAHSNSPEYFEISEPLTQIEGYGKVIRGICESSALTSGFRGDGLIARMAGIKIDVIHRVVGAN